MLGSYDEIDRSFSSHVQGLEDYVLPSSLYRYLASADEPRLLTPRCPDWKRRRGQHLTEVEGGAFQPTEVNLK